MRVLAFPRAQEAGNGPHAPREGCARSAASTLSYLDHFGLRAAPFGLTPDTDFYFASPPHQEALNTLLYAVENGEGFIKVVGAVGTGKTLLCRTLLGALPAHCRAVYLPNPALDPQGILFAIAEELALAVNPGDASYRVHQMIRTRLLELARDDVHVVLVIDEAQAIPLDSLETVRLLSNLETEKRKLLTIVLFGQPELDSRLDAIPQLKTRISFHDRLRPLTRAELAAYLDHRIARAADTAAGSRFTRSAVRAMHAASGGVPRVAHIIAHKALLLAYGRGLQRVRARESREAARDTLGAVPRIRRRRTVLAVLWAVGLAVAAAAALYAGLIPSG